MLSNHVAICCYGGTEWDTAKKKLGLRGFFHCFCCSENMGIQGDSSREIEINTSWICPEMWNLSEKFPRHNYWS